LRNTELMNEAITRAARGDPSAAGVNRRGLLLQFAAAAGISALCVLISPLLAGLRIACPVGLLSGLEGGWHAVWAVAAACAIRAIRDPRAPFAAAISAVAVVAAALAVRGMW